MSGPLDDDNNSTRGVQLEELHRRAVRAELAESMRTMIPGRIESYNPALQLANVQIMVKDFHRNEAGALVVASVPQVCNVPVFSLTGGGFTFTVPMIEGKTLGSLVFAERSLDRYLAGDGSEVDPELYSRFNTTDAFFLPGILPFGAPMSVPPPTDHATAGSITGKRIHFRENFITIGDEAGSKAIALNEDGADGGVLYFTPNAGPTPAALAYVPPPGPYPPAVLPVIAIPLSAKIIASATQAKAK